MWPFNKHRSFTVLLLASALGLAACSQTPVVQTGPDAEVIEGNLHRVDNSVADKAYRDPAVKLTDYDAVILEPLVMDDVEIIYDRTRNYRNIDWTLNDKDKEGLQQLFSKAFASDQRFTLTDQPGPKTLRVTVTLVKLEPNAPKDDFDSRPIGRSTYVTEGFGAISVRAVMEDTETGKVVAIMEDRKKTNGPYERNNSITNRQDISRMFNSWASQLSRGLEKE